MRDGWLKQCVSWITVFGLIATAVACSRKNTDEQRLHQALTSMKTAAEARQAQVILDYLTDDFEGNGGNNKARIAGLLQFYFQQNRHINVLLRVTELKLAGNRATIRCRVVLAGGARQLLPSRARVLVIDSQWRKIEGRWRVQSANWRNGLGQF